MDPVADMFTKIRNGYAVGKETVVVPHSKFKMELAKFLEKEKYIKEAVRRGKKVKKSIEITLLYNNKKPAITTIKKISKPSCRVYVPYKKIFSVGRGRGMRIISTPLGILGNKEARQKKVGGEVIGEIW